ncbi:phage tail protein [Yersinia pseudotuberculosis]|uniref:phage tail protein n=1 Tax=Yersinia pseudotuberculosis TaxID=633 RepID=UPI001FB6CE57|nr:phage tail protein [Yersinia pseudotuberculosis]
MAGKANDAGQGAYDAQVRNDEQDIVLIDHEIRISQAEVTLVEHEDRITTLESDVDYLQDAVIALESDLADLAEDSVSKSSTDDQIVQSIGGSFIIGDVPEQTTDKLQVGGSINVSVAYKVAGLQVIGAQQSGWTTSTGAALKGAFNADLSQTISAAYAQAEVQALSTNLVAARQRIKALEDALRTHGLIN